MHGSPEACGAKSNQEMKKKTTHLVMRLARLGGASLAAIGIYAIIYLWFTEYNLAWIFPTGLIAALIAFSGIRLMAKFRPADGSKVDAKP